MTPKQVADLLVGIAEAQAAVLEAISTTFEKGPGLAQLKQAADSRLFAIQGGTNKKPNSFELLPAQVLRAALAPSTHLGRNLRQTTLAEVEKLLQEPKP